MDGFHLKLGVDRAICNSLDSVWLFYNHPFDCTVVGEGSQHILVIVQHCHLASPVLSSFVHAKCTEIERLVLWNELLIIKG